MKMNMTSQVTAFFVAPLNRSRRRQSARTSPGFRMRGLMSTATRFLASLYDFQVVPRGHEPQRACAGAAASWTAAALCRFRLAASQPKSARGLAQSKTLRRFARFLAHPHRSRRREEAHFNFQFPISDFQFFSQSLLTSAATRFCLALALLFTIPARAVDFHVATAQDLQNALTLAANNGADDIIYLTNGYYIGNFNFNSAEARNLSLLAETNVANTQITLDGAGGGRALNLSSSASANTLTSKASPSCATAATPASVRCGSEREVVRQFR